MKLNVLKISHRGNSQQINGLSRGVCSHVHASAVASFLTKNSRLKKQKIDFGLKFFIQILNICQRLYFIDEKEFFCKPRRIEPAMKQTHLLSNGNNALLLFCLVNAKSSFALTSSVTNHQSFCSIVDFARHFCMQHV